MTIKTAFGLLSLATAAGIAFAASAGVVVKESRSDLNLTLYANGLALIRDKRDVVLQSGINALMLESVSPSMLGNSALIDTGGALRVSEQGLLPANLSHQELLKRHVGKDIRIVRTHPQTGEETAENARVLSIRNGLIVRIGGRIETAPPGRIVFSDIPGDMRAEPVYRIVGASTNGGDAILDVNYLSNGFSWRAGHTLHLTPGAETVRVDTRAILKNASGFDVRGAGIQLLAGTVQRRSAPMMTKQARLMRAEAAPAMAMADGAAPMPARQSLGGFHLYTLDGKLDLPDGADKQVALLPRLDLPVKRKLISEAHANPHNPLRGAPRPTHPRIRLTLTNDKTSGPGLPIPGGLARLYGKDEQGRTQFLGEDHLNDLPVGGAANLSGGRAFDVTVTRLQTDHVRQGLGRNTFEMAYKITLTNGGDKAADVDVIETMMGDWSVLNENIKHVRDNNRAKWTLSVPAGGVADVTYRVRVRR